MLILTLSGPTANGAPTNTRADQLATPTVARTVAATPNQIAQAFSDCRYDSLRLRLKSRGAYADSGDDILDIAWNIDLDIPVVDLHK